MIARSSAAGARGIGDFLCLAASPSFAALALLTASGGVPDIMCMPGSGPIGSMSLMYGLMALFHLSPWLRLLSGR